MSYENFRPPARPAGADPGDADAAPDPWQGAGTDEISTIGRDIRIKGDIEGVIDLLVEGRIVGNVHCNTLLLGEGGSVAGNISAERVRVAGMVKGAIETRDLAIEASGRVKGNVTYARIRISNGGTIEGRFKLRPMPAAKAGADGARPKLIEAPTER